MWLYRKQSLLVILSKPLHALEPANECGLVMLSDQCNVIIPSMILAGCSFFQPKFVII